MTPHPHPYPTRHSHPDLTSEQTSGVPDPPADPPGEWSEAEQARHRAELLEALNP